MIQDHLGHGASKERTDESTLITDSSVPLMHHDPSDLGSLIRIRTTPKERTKIVTNSILFSKFTGEQQHVNVTCRKLVYCVRGESFFFSAKINLKKVT